MSAFSSVSVIVVFVVLSILSPPSGTFWQAVRGAVKRAEVSSKVTIFFLCFIGIFLLFFGVFILKNVKFQVVILL
jgi:heme/copper-type cytochrome/quinol oxidase subunit 2